MRDPDATLHIGETHVTRRLRHPLPDGHFLRSDLAGRWMGDRRLVSYALTDALQVDAKRLPFVSQPTEWCDAQLFDAARLTLDLQREAVTDGFDLKDASAWNVIFSGTRPVFCDLMSFVPLTERKWWAAGQFARHFILPLALARLKGVHARNAFLVSRDGLLPEEARRLLGWSRFLTRYWPAMAGGPTAWVPAPTLDRVPAPSGSIVGHRQGLHETFAWMLNGARPTGVAKSNWSAYRDQRAHYPEGSVDSKREVVQGWLGRVTPGWVLDLGCNTGEFSRLAAESGARVVAIDADHDAIQSLHLSLHDMEAIHPMIASLDDLSGGRGWAGEEHPGLMSRLDKQFDLVLMLALVHHLAVAAAVPLGHVAALVRRCTRRWAIVEWIHETDPQMLLLCGQRQRQPAEFSLDRQRAAFASEGFVVHDEFVLPGGRVLALLVWDR